MHGGLRELDASTVSRAGAATGGKQRGEGLFADFEDVLAGLWEKMCN
jgi:hypothetical protein